MAGARWWTRTATVAVTAAALVGVYLVPAVPAVASSLDEQSEADRAAAAAAAAPPASSKSEGKSDDEGGNWFTDLFDGGGESTEADPIPADVELAPGEHSVDPTLATPAEPGERVRELTGKRTVNTRTFLLDDGQRQVEVAGEPLFYETAQDDLAEIDTAVTDEQGGGRRGRQGSVREGGQGRDLRGLVPRERGEHRSVVLR
jgi:hypothetical protein